MRLAKLHVRAAALSAAVLAFSACQTAQKPVSLLPPASAPAIHSASPSAPPATEGSQPEPAAQQTERQKPSTPDAQQSAPPAPTASNSSSSNSQDSSSGASSSDTASSSSATSTNPSSDSVADLIAAAEKEYQAGLANYRAGKTDAAKHNFDNAMNALLGSNIDIRSDERLQKEFDRIVTGIDALNIGDLNAIDEPMPGGDQAAADQEPQQKSEPAPIDETNTLNPEADASLKAKAEAQIRHTHSDLPLMMTDQVAGFIAYFSGRGRGVFERAYARSGRYRNMIVSTLREEGVPQDLIYLAQAESGFHPLAVSRVGARGIWQFMASRARGYGLTHNMYIDERQDPEKSTRAAARHLKDLYNQFGDWYLAMAAYNSGPGTVQAAVKRTGYADFWELYRRNVLPKETRNYVPIILAVTLMNKNPAQYGLDDVNMDEPAKVDTITIDYPVDLHLVADCAGATTEEIQDLNPSLLRLSTPHTGEFNLNLPAGTKDQYETAVSSIPPDMRLWWRYHSVQSGETLASLARSYHTTAKQITEANHLDGPRLETDAKLVIPVSPGKHPQTDTATYSKRIIRYKVHHGDTVESVAENFGVSPQMLRRWNGIRGSSLAGRRVLALHLPITPSHETETAATHGKTKAKDEAAVKPPTKSAQIERLEIARNDALHEKSTAAVIHHKVKTGETFYSIAALYNTTVQALKRDNHVAVLHPGMILIVEPAR